MIQQISVQFSCTTTRPKQIINIRPISELNQFPQFKNMLVVGAEAKKPKIFENQIATMITKSKTYPVASWPKTQSSCAHWNALKTCAQQMNFYAEKSPPAS